MLVYKLNNATQVKADAQIKDMEAVLSEIAPTLRVLRDLLTEHQSSISEQNINEYRNDLLHSITEAIRLTHMIAINSQRLTTVSDYAAKQFAHIEGQIAEALKGRGVDTATSNQNTQVAKTSPASITTQNSSRAARFSKTFSRV